MNLKINNFTTKYHINTTSLNTAPLTNLKTNSHLNYIPIMDIMGESFTDAIMSNRKLYIEA